ncbi:MAG: ribonuclease HI family protein [Coriobacteriia bacterium]
MSLRATLHTDGGARGNPGPAGIGIVLTDEAGTTLAAAGRYLGEVTNNVAEYQALIAGLEAARSAGVRHLTVHADSELVVRQMNGMYKVKNEGLKPLHGKATALARSFASVRFVHVRRADNAAADALCNEAMDARGDVGHGLGDTPPGPPTLF